MGGGATGALPQITYHDRDKVLHRDVSQRMDYRLDTRSSDGAPPMVKKEPTDDISPLTQDSKSTNTPSSALPPPSTGATPISATSSRPYSPPPAQVPSGPRSGTGVNPPTGPRGGPPPTGPRHGVDRKDPERKWASKDRGGSAEYRSTQTPAQSHHTWREIGSAHPDGSRGIERVGNSSEFPASQESGESSGTAEPAGTEHGSTWATSAVPPTRASGSTTNVTPLALSRSGPSSQGFRGSQNSPNTPASGASGAGPLTPTAPAGPSPTKAPPPTAPRALQASRVRFRNRGGGGGGSSSGGGGGGGGGGSSGGGGGGVGVYRSRNNFGAPAFEGGNDVGHRSAGRPIVGGVDGGTRRGSTDRGRRGSRSGPESDRPAARDGLGDVEMLDARSKDEKKENVAAALKQSSQDQEYIESHTEKTQRSSPPPPPVPAASQPLPVVKIEEEDEEDVSLTQADVISKIADIDGDIEGLEKRLEKLDRVRMHHKEELGKIEGEVLQARNTVPPTEESSAAAELLEPEKMDLDLPEEMNEERQLQSQVHQEQREQQEQQERLERANNSEQLKPETKPVEEDTLDLPDRPRTPTASPSPTPSPIRSRTPSDAGSIETESDESIKHLMISAHPGLPFYRPGPPLKPIDYGFFHTNIQQHEGIRELVVAQISAQRQATFEREADLKRKYREYYEPWHERCLELEKESSRKKKSNSEPADTNGASPAVTASTAAETPTAVGRRAARAGDVVRSEAELEQVIKNLTEQDEQKADSGSKPPGVKEAYVPAMILDPGDRLIFQDTNRLLQSDDEIKSAFLYDVPPDDWTEPEQKLFCDRYMQFPKQWGKIAQGIQGRDFKACILHYYMTKKAHGYKELQKGGGKRGRGKRRKAANPQKTRQSALIADLGRRGGEEEDADSEDVMPTAMTDSGRPKRAAAPVFGGESNSNNSQDSEAAGKRGGKGDDDESRTGGTKRTRGNNSVGRERGQKRARAPVTPAVQPTPPPSVPVTQPALAPVLDKVDGMEKEEKREEKKEEKKEDLGDRETDAVHALTGLSSPAPPSTAPQPVQSMLMPPVVIEDKKPNIINTPTTLPAVLPLMSVGIPIPQSLASSAEPSQTPAIKKEKTDRVGGGMEKPVAQTSSYWSVPEQNDFPQLLAAYGTNWAAIAARLASKTTVMVRNFYQRQVDNGKSEFKQIAEDAERKIRAGEPTPEPPKPAALPKKRYENQIGGPQRMLVPQDPPQALPPNQPPLPSQPVLLQSAQPVRPVLNVEDDIAPIKPAYSPPPPPVSAPSSQNQLQDIRQQPQRQVSGQQHPQQQHPQQQHPQQQHPQQQHPQQQHPQQQHPPQHPPQQHPQQEQPQSLLQLHHPQQPQPPPPVIVPSHSHPRALPPSPQPPRQVQVQQPLVKAPTPLHAHGTFIQRPEETHSGRHERQPESSHDRTYTAHLERQVGGQVVSLAKPFEGVYERPRDGALERQRDVRKPERQAVGGQQLGGSSIERSHGAQERLERSLQDRGLERSHEGLHMNREIPPVHSLPAPSPHTPGSSTSAPQAKTIPPRVAVAAQKQQTHTQQIHHPSPSQQQQQLQQQQGRGSYNQHQSNQPLHHRNLSSPSTMSSFDAQYSQQQLPSQQLRVPPAEKPQPPQAPESLASPSSRPMSAPSSGQPINTPYKPPPSSQLGPAPQIQRQPSMPPQTIVHTPTPPLPVQSQPSANAAPSKPRLTSIHSLLNPAKEEPPSRPQSRPTPPHPPPQTRPQTPQQQPPPQHAPPPQHVSSQLTVQHATQHATQHQSQQPPHHPHHGSLQRLQHPQHAPHSHEPQHSVHHHSQSSTHAPMPRESSRRDVAPYDLPHESHQQLLSMAKTALTRGGQPPYDSAQPPRRPSSYSTPPPREPYLPPRESSYAPALRETSYSTPPHPQSRQGPSGPPASTSHSALQPSGYPGHYPSRRQTCSPYPPGGLPGGPQGGPYAPPPSIPPSHPPHHPQQHPHYGQQPPLQPQPGNSQTPPPQGQYPQRQYYDNPY
ncbi:unnamed protein product [Tuber aestivum]|uniref:SANT domain-containing protein n=1 Tax=Tuber aestivum TaxID=59557 RepID=A0A292PUL2_9PEZI|nr:unnamed protein product [Tuber aestivum]